MTEGAREWAKHLGAVGVSGEFKMEILDKGGDFFAGTRKPVRISIYIILALGSLLGARS